MRQLLCVVSVVLAPAVCAQHNEGGFGSSDVLAESSSDYSSPRSSGGGILTGLHPHVYVKGGGMVVFPLDTSAENDAIINSDDLELRSKIGGGYYAAAGVRFGPGARHDAQGVGYRVEFEYARRFFDTDGLYIDDTEIRDLQGDLDVSTYMGNILVDITADNLRGYGGIGFGLAEVEASVNSISDSDSNFAIQFPFGFETQLVPHVWLDLGVRFLFIPGLESMSDLNDYTLFTTEVFAGLAFEF